jgi:DNA-binding PadR family transcriptional regulator
MAAASMQSSVNWALLGLVIERPSYAYELAQRFERTYDGSLALSSVSHVYTAVRSLQDRGLVEEVAGTRTGRQPRPHYRATPEGMAGYRDWLVGQVREERRRQRLLVLQLGALTREPRAALEIITRSEQECLAEARETAIPSASNTTASGSSELVARLIGEEARLAAGARLNWLQYARRELEALG